MKRLGMLIVLLLTFASCEETNKKVLPVLGKHDISYGENGDNDTTFYTIPTFEFLNQDSSIVRSMDLKGKVWVTEFFFCTCPTICPVMTTQMKRLNIMTKDLSNEIQYISFSINPEHDRPHVLRDYIKKHGIKADNWQFLTGNEEETHRLGVEHFMVHAASDEKAPGGYAHSPAFTLVDREGYVRGVYIGTDTDQVNLMEHDIRKLLKHEYGVE